MRAQLIPLDGGTPIEIRKDMTLVGRKEDSDLRLDHKSVSKQHCVLVKTDGLLLVRDLGSTNGTRVNGQRVRRAALLPNDQLHIASFRFRVYLGPGEAPAASDQNTQQMDAREVVNLLHRLNTNGAKHAAEVPSLPAQPNPLPDVYPDDKNADSNA
jgi:pSer/pThr/pTyr-binding forkhead associated (FHA) protein